MSKLINNTPQKRQLSSCIAMLLLFSSPLAQAANQAICQHTLLKGETVSQIAQQQQMSVAQLHTFNILHGENFKVPFDQLKTGTVVLTPCNDNANQQSGQALANLAAGAAATTTDRTAYLEDYARQYAVNQVNTKISNELSPWGHAQIQLNVDRKGNFNGTNATMLIPLKNTPQWLTFTQLSVHNDDNHEWTGNIGIGERYFTPSWMIGANTFYDRNFNADQQRMGVGLEYWRNDLKLSTNGYFRLSNTWHDATQLQDYEARPANGWDMDLQGWIPQLPQLGGELKVAHYYGDEVGLMGDDKNDLQQNPYSMMVGVNYTPFPLATFSLSLNSSDQHERDVRFSVSLDLLFGQSLASQLDPTSVSTMRSLMGQRLDFVNRNNNIVLEYRKKILLIMSMIPSITGQAGEQYQLNTKVDTVKYAPATITITAPNSFDSNGGSIINNGSNSFSVKLPNYNDQSNNKYILTGIATDREGNQSQPVYTTVNVVGAAISALNSTVNLETDIIWVPYPTNSNSKLKLGMLKVDPTVADTVTIKLKDQSNQPVSGQENELTLSIKNADQDPLQADDPHLQSSHPKAVPNEPGTYTDEILAGEDLGKYNVFVSIPDDNLVLNPNGLPFEERYIPDENSLHFSNIVWENQNDPAVDDNPKDFNELTVTVLDQYGNFAAPGTMISFSAPYSGGGIYSSNGNWQAEVGDDGTATIYLYSSEEISGQEGTIVASLDTPTGTETDNITIDFIADAATAHVNKITAPNELMVNGAAGDVTADVVDNSNSPVPNVSVQFSSTDSAAIFSSQTVNSDAEGQAKVQLSNTTKAGTAEIKATSPNSSLDTSNTASVLFTPHKASYSISNISWSNMQQPAVDDNSSSTNTIIATVTDSAGNPAAAGTVVTFAAPNSNQIQPVGGSWQVSVTGNNGQATIQLISNKAISGDAGKITANINGSSQALNVSFIPDVAKAHVNRITAPNELMVKGAAGDVIANIVDNTNNPVPNVNVQFSADNTAAIFSSTTANSDATGQATVKLSNNTTAGRATITATSANSSLDQNNTTNVMFTPYSSSYSISNISWSNPQQPAVDDDATSTNSVVATVTDSAGNPAAAGTIVTFSAPNSSDIKPAGESWQIAVTGDKGQATIQLVSSKAIDGDAGKINAYINGTSQSLNIRFIPDTTKAHINQITVPNQLMVKGAAGEVIANVVDNTNNPVPNMAIQFSSNNPAATFSNSTATTNTVGQATVQVSNTTKAGTANITAVSTNPSLDSNNTAMVLFTPHTASYSISNMTWTNTQQPAVDDDSNSTNKIVVTITDSAGNPAAAGTIVSFTAPNSGEIQPVGGNWQAEVIGNDGQATIQLISNKTITGDAGKITAYINGVSQSVNVSFIPDIAKAHVNKITAPSELMVKGSAGDVMANVVDNTNNPVPNVNVQFNSNNPEIIFSSVSANSNATGQAMVQISNNTKAGSANIQATSKNSSLDTNNSTTVQFTPNSASYSLNNITWSNIQNPAVDDDTGSTNKIIASVTDSAGNPAVAGTIVTFSAPNSSDIQPATGTWQVPVTGNNGQATIELVSNKAITANAGQIMATINGTSQSLNVSFVPDIAKAHVEKLTAPSELMVKGTAGEVIANVVDNTNNPVPNVNIQFSSDNSAATFSNTTASTDTAGNATVQITNTTKAGSANIKATSNNSSLDSDNTATILFTPHTASYSIGTISWTNMQNPAVDDNNTSTNSIVATVTDSAGNPAKAGTIVTFSAPNSSDIQPVGGNWQVAVTGNNGQATIQVISNKTIIGDTGKITANINGSSQSINVSFIPDIAKAHIKLLSTPTSILTGNLGSSISASVVDETDNPVPNIQVNFTTDNPIAKFTYPSVNTNNLGIAQNMLFSLQTGVVNITASSPNAALDNSNIQRVTFKINPNTYQIGSLVWSNQNSPAVDDESSSYNTLVATLLDGNGKPVPAGTLINFSAPNSSDIEPAGGTWQVPVTGSDGQAIIQFISNKTITGDAGKITATINGVTQSINIAFIADTANAHVNKLTAPNQLMVKGSAGDVIANVVDNTNNPVSNITVQFSSNDPAAIFSNASTTSDAAGHALTQVSNTTKAGLINITAMSPNSSLDRNSTATVLFTPHTASYSIGNISWSNMQNPAVDDDNSSTNTIIATVLDSAGNPATAGTLVTFAAPNSSDIQPAGGSWQAAVTGKNGQATIQLISNKTITADAGKITATINGTSQSLNISFIPDVAKAHIKLLNAPTSILTGALGSQISASVVDETDNPVPNVLVNFTTDNPIAKFTLPSVSTNSLGVAYNVIGSLQTGLVNITVSSPNPALDSSNTQKVTFKINPNTYQVGSLVWSNQNTPAVDDESTSYNTITATLVDGEGRPVPAGTMVSFSTPNTSDIQPAGGTWKVPVIGNNGQATIQLISSKTITADAGKVTAMINGTSQSLNVSFIPNVANAHVDKLSAPSQLMIKGTAGDVIANVVDNTNNPVPNVTIKFSSNDPAAIFSSPSVITDMTGKALVQLTNITSTGSANITAISPNGSLDRNNTSTVLFTPHTTSYAISNISWSNMQHPAVDDDNSSTNRIIATVTDSAGNPATAGTVVTFAAPNSGDIQPVGGSWQVPVIGTAGQASIQLISNKTVATDTGTITASVNGTSQSLNISFIPDVAKAHIKLLSVPSSILTGTLGSPISASVVDETDNPVPNIPINFSSDNPIAKFSQLSVNTNSLGIAQNVLFSAQTGLVSVTAASPNPTLDSSNTQRVTFKINPNTYKVSSLVWSNQSTPAVDDDTASSNTVLVTLLDGEGKPVPAGTLVNFSAPNSSDIQPVGGTWQVPVIGAAGQASIQFISSKTITGNTGQITATINGTSQSVNLSFIPDVKKAHVSGLNIPSSLIMTIFPSSFSAIVVDGTNNPVPNVVVKFGVDTPLAFLGVSQSTSDSNGLAHSTILSKILGLITITATSPNPSLDVNNKHTIKFLAS